MKVTRPRNERKVVELILAHVRKALRGCLATKHNDIGTKGVPDISVQFMDAISWAEIKYLRPGDKLADIIDGIQAVFCHQCATINRGRAWVVVYDQERDRTVVWTPRALFASLWPHMAQDFDGWKSIGREPVEVDNLKDGPLVNALQTFGAFWIKGWHYDVVSHLVVHHLRSRANGTS